MTDIPNVEFEMTFGAAVPSVSKTRWWSREEWHRFFLKFFYGEGSRETTFGDWVKDMYEKHVMIDGVRIKALYKIFVPGAEDHDPQQLAMIKMEMAVVVDVTEPLIKATYVLESDGPVSLVASDVLSRTKLGLEVLIPGMDFPNVKRIAAELTAQGLWPQFDFPGGMNYEDSGEAWIAYAKIRCMPCYNYFSDVVMMHPCMPLFGVASLANPNTFRHECINIAGAMTGVALRNLLAPACPKLVSPTLLDKMIAQLAQYMRAVQSVNWDDQDDAALLEKIADFWAEPNALISAWREFAFLCYLIQPSSACVERSFSILKNIYGDLQTRSLNDLVKVTLQLRYNYRDDR